MCTRIHWREWWYRGVIGLLLWVGGGLCSPACKNGATCEQGVSLCSLGFTGENCGIGELLGKDVACCGLF